MGSVGGWGRVLWRSWGCVVSKAMGLRGAARPRCRAGGDAGSLCRPSSLARLCRLPRKEGQLMPCRSHTGSLRCPLGAEPQLDMPRGLGVTGK